MKTLYTLLLITLAAPLFSNSRTTTALEAHPETHLELVEVEVIGRKEQRSLKELPLSATTLRSHELTQQNVFNIKELTALVPNLFMPDYGTKLTSPIYIRGIGSRINSPSVGLYVDGIPYFEKSTFDFDLMEIAQVEVLRGPQGTLYGRNTMGGIIQVTTLAPLSYEGTRVALNVGNYSKANATASHYGKFSEWWGYSVSANVNTHDGYFLNTTTNSAADALNSGSARARIRYKRGGWDVSGVSSVEFSEQTGYPYAKLDSVGKVTDINYNDPSFFKRTMNSNGMIAQYKNRVVELTSRTAHQYYDAHQGIDQDFTPTSTFYVNQYEKQQMVSQELEVKNAQESRISYTAGVSGFYQQFDKQVVLEAYRQRFITDKYYYSTSYGASAYGQATFNGLFTKGLSLTAGVRYDLEYATMDYRNFRETPTQREELTASNYTHKLSFEQISPKASLQYQLAAHNTLYATVTKGYKSGGFNTSFVTDEEKSFKPEYSWNYEIGTKLSFAGGAVTTEAALFYIDWQNQQVYQPLSTGIGSLLRNAGESVSLGAELAAGWRIVEPLQVQVSYGFTQATFKEYVKGSEILSGNYLPYIPKHTVSGAANYTISPQRSIFDRIVLSVQYNGVGPLYWNDSNTVKQDFYHLLGGRATFQIAQFSASVWAKNLFNTNYAAFYFEALGSSYMQKGRPTTFGVELTYSF